MERARKSGRGRKRESGRKIASEKLDARTNARTLR